MPRRSVIPVPSMDAIFRPWHMVVSEPKVRSRTAPGELFPPAFIEWGAQSQFTMEDSFRDKAKSVTIDISDDDDDEEEDTRARFTYNEEGRRFTDIAVFETTDVLQYVVQRYPTAIAFNAPGGDQILTTLSIEVEGTQAGSGQEPPVPPILEEIP